MSGPRPDPDAPTRPASAAGVRLQREAQALRDNLRRRKDQARARLPPGPDAALGRPTHRPPAPSGGNLPSAPACDTPPLPGGDGPLPPGSNAPLPPGGNAPLPPGGGDPP